MCTGKEESFREINPFVSGNQENRLISVRNLVWENLTTKTKDPLKRSTGIGLDVPTLLVPACPCPFPQPWQAGFTAPPASPAGSASVSTGGKQLHSHLTQWTVIFPCIRELSRSRAGSETRHLQTRIPGRSVKQRHPACTLPAARVLGTHCSHNSKGQQGLASADRYALLYLFGRLYEFD